MIFTIEPMINAGRRDIRELGDGWTIVTKDRSLSAQWEHTVLVTDTGYEVLTLSAGSPPPPAFVARPSHGTPLAECLAGAQLTVDRAVTGRRAAWPSTARSAIATARPRCCEHFARSRAPTAPARDAAADAQLAAPCRRDAAASCGRTPACRAGAALVAVGGYGRGELFPHSDIDVLVLLPGATRSSADADDALRAAIEGFITACWDIGLEIGSSRAHGRRMPGRGRAAT